MSKLNQYIGGIVSSITSARSICDVQTVELAKQYAEHDLLKHFSVPRMRIADIEMTIPVAIDAPNPGGFDTFDKPRLANAVIDAGINFISLKKQQITEFKEASYNTTVKYGYKLRSTDDIEAYSKNVTAYFIEIGSKFTEEKFTIDRQEALASRIKEVAKSTLASDTNLLGDTNVIIEASQLREIPRENLIYIKMKIREEGMEWAISENKEGEVQSTLLSE